MKQAIQWLRENLEETPTTAARVCNIKKEDSVKKAWQRERKRIEKGRPQWGGHNKILRPEMHNAMIRYAVEQATNGGKGATKQMMFNCAMWLRVRASEEIEEADQEMDEVEEGGGGSGIVLCSSPPILVASIDSIVENADFVSLE
jgi:hypothetical protein